MAIMNWFRSIPRPRLAPRPVDPRKQDVLRLLQVAANPEAPAETVRDAILDLSLALNDPEPGIRLLAMAALCELGPAARIVADAIHVALSDPIPQIRRYAIMAVGHMGSDPNAMPGLLAACRDVDEGVRRHAMAVLGEFGSGREDVVAALVLALEDLEPRNRAIATVAIRRCGPIALGPLEKALFSEAALVRAKAADLLGRLGNAAREAVPSLKKLLDDPSEDVREAAIGALAVIGE